MPRVIFLILWTSWSRTLLRYHPEGWPLSWFECCLGVGFCHQVVEADNGFLVCFVTGKEKLYLALAFQEVSLNVKNRSAVFVNCCMMLFMSRACMSYVIMK